jgi:hypothetical protein
MAPIGPTREKMSSKRLNAAAITREAIVERSASCFTLAFLACFEGPSESVSVQPACDALFWGTSMPGLPFQASIEKEEFFSQAGGKMYQGDSTW